MVSDRNRGRRDVLKTSGALFGVGLAGCLGGEAEEVEGGVEQPEYVVRPEMGSDSQVLSETLDPGFTGADIDTTGNVYQMLYDFLVAETPAPDHEIVPQLATDWEIDGTTVEFTLREGVQFHSGNELTAEDVVYSFERAEEMDGPAWSLFRGQVETANMHTPDDYTVIVELEEPWLQFIGSLANFAIVDKETIEANEEDGDWGHEWMQGHAAGCGPYKLEEFDNAAHIRFERFEDYWGGWDDHDNPINKYEGLIGQEDSTIIQMWESDDAHYVGHNLANETYDRLEPEDDTVIYEVDTIQHWFMSFNTTKEPYDDVNVRNAISEAVDYETAQDLIMPGSQAGAGPVPRPLEEHNENIEPGGAPDTDAAQDRIDAADYTLDEINEAGGMRFSDYSGSGPVNEVPLLFQDNLGSVGIESEIRNVTFAEISESSSNPDEAVSGFGANYRGGGGAPVTADPYLYLSHHSNALGSNFYSLHWYQDDEVDELLEATRDGATYEDVREPTDEVQEILDAEKPVMWVSNPRHFVAMKTQLKGFQFRATTGQRMYPYDWDWDPEATAEDHPDARDPTDMA